MWKEIGEKTLWTSLAGYATLASYTWPQGFIPIVTFQSLPILLLGFAFILLIVLLFLGILFLPFWYFTNESRLRKGLYGSMEGVLPRKFRGKQIDIPVTQLLRDMYRQFGGLDLVLRFLPYFIGMAICFYSWFAFSSVFENRILLIPIVPILWIGFKSLSGVLGAKSFSHISPYLIGILMVFIILPSIPFAESSPKKYFTQNFLVRDALRVTGLGGGISVQTQHYNENGNPEVIRGKLLFSDGKIMWIKPCSMGRVTRVQLPADVVSYHEDDICLHDSVRDKSKS